MIDIDIEEQIIRNHDQADLFISLFFASFDSVLYIVVLVLFGLDSKSLFSRKQHLSLLIMIDVFLRIFNLYTASLIYSFPREIISSCFVTSEFYIIINLFNKIFLDKRNPNYSESSYIQFKNIYLLIFFTLSLLLNFSKIISFIQYILAIVSLYLYGNNATNKLILFMNGIVIKDPNTNQNQYFIQIISSVTLLYYFIYYLSKIIGLFFDTLLYQSYIEIFGDIFKEVGKYLIFIMLINMYFLYNKYIKEEFYEVASNENFDNANIQNKRNDISIVEN
jgi:hypothetical protein